MGNWVVSFSNAIVAYPISGTNPFTAVAFDRGGPAEAVQSSSLPALGFHVAHQARPSTVNAPVELSRSVWLTTSISPRPLQEPLPLSVGIDASWHANHVSRSWSFISRKFLMRSEKGRVSTSSFKRRLVGCRISPTF